MKVKRMEELMFCSFLVGAKLQFLADKNVQQDLDIELSSKAFLQMCENVRQGKYSLSLEQDPNKAAAQMQKEVELLCCNKMLKTVLVKNNMTKGIYFAYIDDEDDENHERFAVADAEYWNKHKCLEDQHIMAKTVFPPGFNEVSESYFEYEGTAEEGKTALKGFGFTENVGLLP